MGVLDSSLCFRLGNMLVTVVPVRGNGYPKDKTIHLIKQYDH